MKENIASLLRKTPKLRGKEIAKKLNLNKKEVNLFLSQNKDSFYQNKDFRWSNLRRGELIIEFEADKWIDCVSFENSLKKSGQLLESEFSFITFCLPNKCKMLLIVTARFLSLCNQLVATGKQVIIDFEDSYDSLTYLDRIGFVDQLHEDIVVKPHRPNKSRALKYNGNSNSVVEIGYIDPKSKNKELVVKLTKTFVEQYGESYYQPIFNIFGELVGNICEHSDTSINGIAGLQRYKGHEKHIQTVVSDSGVGIAKTLRPSLEAHYPDLYTRYREDNIQSDIGLVKEVLTQGSISRKGEGGGLGYMQSKEYAMKFDARISIRQETYSLEFIYKNGSLESINQENDLIKLCGTHVCFDFTC